MPQTADCINTQSENGRNLTPEPILIAAHSVLGHIELDPASDAIANQTIQAKRYYTKEQDGFTQEWRANTAWLNAPGRSQSKGKLITASAWYRKLFHCWQRGEVKHAIALVYRCGSVGSLGIELLSQATVCLTCSGVESSAINGSGRLSFETVEGDRRIPQSQNTQSSLIFLLSHDLEMQAKFRDEFSVFGVVK